MEGGGGARASEREKQGARAALILTWFAWRAAVAAAFLRVIVCTLPR